MHNEKRSGRPSHALGDDAAINATGKIVEEDRRYKIDKFCDLLPTSFEIGRSSVAKILTKNLGLQKVCARWIAQRVVWWSDLIRSC